MSRLIALLPALSLACFAHCGDAAEASTAVFARAVGKTPSEDVVRYVAQKAQPTVFAESGSLVRARTVKQVIVSLCGSVQPGYLAELSDKNGLSTINENAPVADVGNNLQFPACLYASTEHEHKIQYSIVPNDTLGGIRQKLTGDGRYDRRQIDAFFAASALSSQDAKDLKPGHKVVVPLFTTTTALIPVSTKEEFGQGLAEVGGSAVATEENPAPPGAIVDAVQFAPTGGIAGATQGVFAPCESGDGSRPYPYDPVEVRNAFVRARDRLTHSLSLISVIAIDNGFFGAPCNGDTCPAIDGDHVRDVERFPAAFFDRDLFGSHYGYGPVLMGSHIDPLNFWNNTTAGVHFTASDINEETGHGTHVAGLVLGGPQFMPYRKEVLYAPGNKPWITLVIAAISGGNRQLAIGSDRNLPFLLTADMGIKIVNMSVAFYGKADPLIGMNIRNFVNGQPDALFAVAAGNDGTKDIEKADLDEYPARAGGPGAANVITVASIDGPKKARQELSAFTNAGARYVDIAAPGCEISSWINAEGDPVAISGTSQATPMVSFGAALLRSVWRTQPARIKNRLLYAGDLLDVEADRNAIASKAQLNIAKALTFQSDRITYRDGNGTHALLGTLSTVQGLQCDGAAPIAPADLRAAKRDETGRWAIYTVDSGNALHVCWGAFKSETVVHLNADSEVVAGRFDPPPSASVDVSSAQLSEIIRSN